VGATNPAQIRIRTFGGAGSWDTITSSNITSISGAGTSAACTDPDDNTGDYVIVRVPLATLSSPKEIAIAEGVNIGIPASADEADEAGWPTAGAVFDTPAAIFDLTVWQPPTGAVGCYTAGIDGHPICQVPPPTPAP
jgi:hypothetical protein